ncbi:VWA domain-containing protein [Ectopseudomonas alcaliphila]|uniref:VWA domain containing CoxE-like protein n=1 Tax=Ectopseudomonas alcaliphila TaxID=101564 RepID=A0A1G7EJ67_9GAMM|nr:VWA domain-containing protein [Pseudomonas alcaliphila]MDX5990841.1 VWA domain-containing protein [Pseudomonas alcaliphila]SDE63637.1 VWA domain containing CoxE-like protein [Pseudomonas alcaliphila]
MTDLETARRWRLILGRYADRALHGANFDATQARLDKTLDYLYNREYQRRGHVQGGRAGSLDDSQLTALNWLEQAHSLFPRSTFERLQAQAIERYEISALLTDPASLATLEPSPALAKALLGVRGRLGEETRDAVRQLITRVVEEILQRLRSRFTQAIQGRRNRFRRSLIKNAQNFDWRATIAANLKHYDPQSKRLLIESPRFNARIRRQLPWDIILCVDQSGSMLDSVMYSAICASILASLPSVRVRLVLFDTQVVDLSHLAHDPVEVLLTVQLGGGTDIGKAMRYCEQLVENPQRTVLTLISDFEEGAAVSPLLACVARLNEARVKLLGLAALDDSAQPVYDPAMGQRLAARGMHIAALTPEHFAQWLAEVMQ